MHNFKPLQSWIFGCGLVGSLFALTACRTTSDTYVDYQDRRLTPVQPRLDLKHFDLVDTQGRTSIGSSDPDLRLDPRNNFGDFTLSWDANFSDDYRATFYVSPTIFASDGRQIAYNYCGYRHNCGFTGSAFCTYRADYSVSCASNASVDLAGWITPSPRKLFLILELCDTRSLSCQQDFHEVTFY